MKPVTNPPNGARCIVSPSSLYGGANVYVYVLPFAARILPFEYKRSEFACVILIRLMRIATVIGAVFILNYIRSKNMGFWGFGEIGRAHV